MEGIDNLFHLIPQGQINILKNIESKNPICYEGEKQDEKNRWFPRFFLSHSYRLWTSMGLWPYLKIPQPIVNLRSVSAYSSEAYIISVRSRLVPEEFCLIDDSWVYKYFSTWYKSDFGNKLLLKHYSLGEDSVYNFSA